VRARIAIDGYDQTLEIDSPLETAAAPGDRVPLTLANARIFPASEDDFLDPGEGI
jgi:sulfate transport system ATP-binding protein